MIRNGMELRDDYSRTNPLRVPPEFETDTTQLEMNNNNTCNRKIIRTTGDQCFLDKYYKKSTENSDGKVCADCKQEDGKRVNYEPKNSSKKLGYEENSLESLVKDKLILDVYSKPRLKYSISNLYELMSELRKAFETDNVNIQYVSAIMSAYKSNPKEWERFAKFDKFRYTRNLVDAGNGKYNLMLLCWGEGHGSAIHDHANAHCFMKMLHGELCETRFEWPEYEVDPDNITPGEEANLKEKGRTILRENEVCYINDSLGLHRVENVSNSERAVSLHLYCPPFDSCSVFNQRTGHRTKSKVTFWSIYGERCNKKFMEDPEPEDN